MPGQAGQQPFLQMRASVFYNINFVCKSHTHTHTHRYTYMYIFIYNLLSPVCVCVWQYGADEAKALESTAGSFETIGGLASVLITILAFFLRTRVRSKPNP